MKKEKSYTVYMHINKINGKKYIGITGQDTERRWQKGHGYDYGGNLYFYNSIKKYGWDNFIHEILFQNLTKEESENKEIELIKKYNSTNCDFGYNHNNGGSCVGMQTEEYKEKMSELQKEIWKRNPSRCVYMSEKMKGKKLSEETKDKLRQINLGKKQSPETIGKRVMRLKGQKRPTVAKFMSERRGEKNPNYGKPAHKNIKEALTYHSRYGQFGSSNPCAKAVLQFDKSDNFIEEYETAIDAVRKLNLTSNHISECCKGIRKTAHGFIWKYKEGELISGLLL